MRPTRAEISLPILKNNFNNIKKKVGQDVKIMGIVKANAYGHGLVEISRALVHYGIDYLGVGFLEEGLTLRKNGISAPILVLGGVLGDQIQHFLANNLEITVSSIELARRIDKEVQDHFAKKAKVHLKIDTGMERIGVHSNNAPNFIEEILKLKHVEIVGIYSHLATADLKDKSFAHLQLERFNQVLDYTQKIGIDIPLKHIANSSAVLDLQESYYNMVRPGILLYGLYPSEEVSKSVSVEPILSLKSKIVFIKTVEANTSISYGRKYFTKNKTRIATIPVGYGDGYSRMLTNKTDVIINGKRFPVVGAICMDQIMVDIGEENVHVGDDVTLIGKDGNEFIDVWELANKIGTNAYEILCNLNTRVPRIYN
ncbi:MAG: Alanine racemase [Ignavibacteriae bacterium]|nr:MAG: Alanine racemase [Ignavibacteriota bacterium]